jgi:ribosomal protein L11 methyltransferase
MEKPSWLEASLVVDAELAEAVAEVLARYAPGGVVIESTQIGKTADGAGAPTGPLRVYAYLPVDDSLEEKRQKLEEGLWHLGQIRPLPEPQFKRIQAENWMENWKQFYHPIRVGQKLLVLPAWLENPDPARIPIRIDPGMAFGTGTHPTTQLSLQLIEEYLRPGTAMLDIGCGSAILSIAAVKLGAAAAYGVDIDAAALESAQENLERNQVGGQVQLAAGSLDEVRQGVFPIRRAPLVAANILANILIRLLNDGLAELVQPGGVLLLSGILEEGEGELLAVLNKHRFTMEKRLQIEDWLAFAVRLPG